MLTPEQLDELSHPVIELYAHLETEIINAMVKRLKTESDDEIMKDNVLHWQIEKLRQLNDLNKDVISMLHLMSGKTVNALTELVHKATAHSIKPMETWLSELAKDGHIDKAPPLEQDDRIFRTLKAFQNTAKSDMNLVNANILKNVPQVYRDIISKTVASVMVGHSFQKALTSTAQKWADQGIPALIDRAGRHWSIEGYIPLVVKSTANNVANQAQFDRMDSYNLDLIEISSHLAARPLCAPYQGQIFSRNGGSRDYPPLSSTSYGKAAGLFGCNCRHFSVPYIPNVSVQRFRPYPAAENAQAYQVQQQQRSIEREIRKAKRKLNVAQNLGDKQQIDIATQKVREKHAKMRTFIQDNNVTRRRNREQLHLNNPNVGGGQVKQKPKP